MTTNNEGESMTAVSTTSTSNKTRRSPDEFDVWMQRIAARIRGTKGPFFVTAPEDLNATFLGAFPEGPQRQTHNCSCCRHFLRRYGSLVTIDAEGRQRPVFWDDVALGPYGGVESALAEAVARAPVRGVHLDSNKEWGTSQTGTWSHFGFPSPTVFKHPLKRASEVAAERKEDYGMLSRALAEFPLELVQRAIAILKTDSMYRSEKVTGVAEWFAALHAALQANKNKQRRSNLVWRAVATAPPGFAHVRSTMIGTLLEDLARGLPGEEVARRFRDKMHPLQYQRPTAPPSEGAIVQAEKAFAALGAAGALKRRFAKLEDLQVLWTPRRTQEKTQGEGIFSHLRPGPQKSEADIGTAPTTMTWEKFARTVLPGAEKMECRIDALRNLPLAAFVTAADMDAPPIVQWDRAERRNPVTWYQYVGGSAPSRWNLAHGWASVTAAVLLPYLWDPERPMPHQPNGLMLVLDGCRDVAHERGGGLFPELLKNDFHAYRSVVEAYTLRAAIEGRNEATACGFMLQAPDKRWDCVVRVTAGGLKTTYRLDRWD